MKNKLILVGGIPGSGKSTIANKIKEHLEGKGLRVKLYNEGDAHPADMSWNAFIKIDEYKELLKNNPEHGEKIKEYTQLEEDYALVAYTRLGFGPKENDLMTYFQNHEVYDEKSSYR